MTDLLTTHFLPIEDLDREYNVRRDLGDLTDLTDSIRRVGVLQPVTVTNSLHGYVLVAGYRRVAAAEAAGLTEVPVHMVEFDSDEDRLVATLVENLIRQDLDPLEEAAGFKLLIESGWSRKKIAGKVSRSNPHITKRLKLLELPETIQEKLRDRTYTVDHGYKISRLASEGKYTDKQLEKQAARPTHLVEQELERKILDKKMNKRVDELMAKGSRAKAVRNVWADNKLNPVDGYKMRGVDPDAHPFEPCHLTVVTEGYGDQPILENGYCDDMERHLPAGESTLKVGDKEAEAAKAEEEREAKREAARAEHQRLWNLLTEQLATVPIERQIEMIVRRTAKAKLDGQSKDLLGFSEDLAYGQQVPHRVVDGTSLETLVTALTRQWLAQIVTYSWFVEQRQGDNEYLPTLALATEMGLIEASEEDEEEHGCQEDDEIVGFCASSDCPGDHESLEDC